MGAKLRPGNVHSAEDWEELLLPEIERQQKLGKQVVLRADAAFAKPEIYEVLEERGAKYAIRIPANDSLERDIAELLTRPVGRPSHKPEVCTPGGRSLTLKQRLGAWLFPRMPITRFLFDQLRTEINCGKVRLENGVLPSRRRNLKRIRQTREIRANIACGPHPLSGFLNLDLYILCPEVIAWDCRRDLPFADGSVAGLRVEHFLEHLEPREELPAFLKDCLRVLRAGGVLRIIVPDAERYLHAYCEGDLSGFRELAVPVPFPSDLTTRMDVVNHVFHQWHEHRWGYDCETLAHRLRTAGFGRIERTSYQCSLDPLLAQDCENHFPYSLYVDAVRT